MIITLNEEANIERCIRSVPFTDDIVVVDSFSTDRTVELAQNAALACSKKSGRAMARRKPLPQNKPNIPGFCR